MLHPNTQRSKPDRAHGERQDHVMGPLANASLRATTYVGGKVPSGYAPVVLRRVPFTA